MAEHDPSKNPPQIRLRENELELMRTLFEQAPMFVGVTQGPEHRVTYINPTFRKLLGNLSLRPGMTASEILPTAKSGNEEEVRKELDRLNHIYASGEPLIVNEFKTTLDRKGTGRPEEIFINSVYQPLKDERGQVYGLFLAGYEVTDHVRAREEILYGEHRLALALNGARMGYWEFDMERNRLDMVSEQLKKHYGFPVDKECTLEDFLHAIHPEDRVNVPEFIEKAMKDGQFYEMEYRVPWPDGSMHWLLARGRFLRDSQGKPQRRIGITMDITPHKQVEQKLEEAVSLRDDFLAIASHELQTPVTSLKIHAELLERQLRTAGETVWVEQVEKLSNRIEQLSRLTIQLLDTSRMQQEGLKMEKEIFSLNELIREKVEALSQISHHTLEVQEESVQDNIFADRFHISQVLRNLLENAIKYSPEADRVIVRVTDKPGEVVVSVIDFGIGIPNREKLKVFERFYKGQDDMRKTFPGFGIGLYIARQIVEHHGGDIWVEDNPEGGSVFSISLPLANHKSV